MSHPVQRTKSKPPPVRTPEWKKQPLPEGWEERSTEDAKTYFLDHNKRQSSWIDPRDSPTHNRGPQDLPYGWDYCVDKQVGLYFINHLKQKNTFDDPRNAEEYAARRARFVAMLDEERLSQEGRKEELAHMKSSVKRHEDRVLQIEKKMQTVGTQIEEGDFPEEVREELREELKQMGALLRKEHSVLVEKKEAYSNAKRSVAAASVVIDDLEKLTKTTNEQVQDELPAARESTLKLKAVKDVYDADHALRLLLQEQVRSIATESQLNKLVGDIDELDDVAAVEQAEEVLAEPTQRGEGESRTRLELGLELLTMRQMVDSQKAEIAELKLIKRALEKQNKMQKAAVERSSSSVSTSTDNTHTLPESAASSSSSLDMASGAGKRVARAATTIGIERPLSRALTADASANASSNQWRSSRTSTDATASGDAAPSARTSVSSNPHHEAPTEVVTFHDRMPVRPSSHAEAGLGAGGRRKSQPAMHTKRLSHVNDKHAPDHLDEQAKQDFHKVMEGAHGKTWQGTLRRVYRRGDSEALFPSRPEQLDFDTKLSLFKRIVRAPVKTNSAAPSGAKQRQ